MGTDADIKRQVKDFYDAVGWKPVGEGLYQNIRYEDQRPVSQDYIRACRRRVLRHLPPSGDLLLDAGCGPIQYPEYVEYSRAYGRRVCLDISMLALQEARQRIDGHGWFVLGDLVHLPFRAGAFPGAVSMHVVYHLPADEQEHALRELERVLHPGGKAVVVYSWGRKAPLMRLAGIPMAMAEALLGALRRLRRRRASGPGPGDATADERQALLSTPGHYSHNHSWSWMRARLADLAGLDLLVWRSLNTRFLRTFIHGPLLGRSWLRLITALEERFPRFFGRVGQYPMILFEKPDSLEPRQRGAT